MKDEIAARLSAIRERSQHGYRAYAYKDQSIEDVAYLLDVAEAAAAFLAAWEDDPTGGHVETCDGAVALIEAFKGNSQ